MSQLRYLLDTDTVIYFFKGRGGVPLRFQQTQPTMLGVSAVSLYELRVGVLRSSNPERSQAQLDTLLQQVNVVPFSDAAAQAAAEVRAYLERQGMIIGTLDTLIAGTAIAHGLILVSHNLAEFQRVPNLRVEDWY